MHCDVEFETLRSTLYDRYYVFGVVVPNLPPKKSMSSLLVTDVSIPLIKERTYGLSLFCESIMKNPFLRCDTDWINFMRPNEGGSSQDIYVTEENKGEVMIINALMQLEIPSKFTLIQRMADLKEEVTSIDKQGSVHSA